MASTTISAEPADYLPTGQFAQYQALCTVLRQRIRTNLTGCVRRRGNAGPAMKRITSLRNELTASQRALADPNLGVDTVHREWIRTATLARQNTTRSTHEADRLEDAANAMLHNRDHEAATLTRRLTREVLEGQP